MKNFFLSNEYTTEYFNIIENANIRVPQTATRKKAKIILGYTEHHHIIPSSLGGSDDIYNKVWLTAYEHLKVHLLLTKMVSNEVQLRKVHLAAVRMANPQNKTLKRLVGDENIEGISEIREEAARLHSEYMKNKHTGKNNPMYGKHHSKESKEAKSKANTGLIRTDKTKKLIGDAKLGDLNPGREKVTCPKCGFTGLAGGVRKYHFNNCTAHLIYSFKHDDGRTFTGTRTQLLEQFLQPKDKGAISNMIGGRQNGVRGWRLLPILE